MVILVGVVSGAILVSLSLIWSFSLLPDIQNHAHDEQLTIITMLIIIIMMIIVISMLIIIIMLTVVGYNEPGAVCSPRFSPLAKTSSKTLSRPV